MASSSSSSSSSSSRHWRYHVFPSFSGEDVRRTFLSHIHKEFRRKGIETFKDDAIKRSQTIGPELVQAVRESRISIVLLSRNYASSSWCLTELLEIMNCRETAGQTVMTIFYEVDPYDVRKQTGDFGKAFKKTCVGKTEEETQRWRQALKAVAEIAGEHSKSWDNEANMIEKIARDVSNELNYSTPSRDFDRLVGMRAHLAKMKSLLCLESNEVRMVGIVGPAGIGKTTIARALYDRFSSKFQLTCFMENIAGKVRRTDLDEYGFKLHLQERCLSRILDHEDLRIHHLGVAQERLMNQKVLLVLDGVDELEQLEALAGETKWFGSGSRIIVTTADKNLFRRHGIHHIYEVDLPSYDKALQIFCHFAFGQNSPPGDFQDLAPKVAAIAGRLLLGLKVLGSSLRGMGKDNWISALPRLENCLDGRIERVLKVGYDNLSLEDRAVFRHIACLFNHEPVDRVKQLLDGSTCDCNWRLQILGEKCLIYVSVHGLIMMQNLLQQMGREIVRRQSINEPGKREFLVDIRDIHDVLTDNTGTETVLGISICIFDIPKLFISDRAFERMRNLRFLRFYCDYLFHPGASKVFDLFRLYLPRGLNYLPRKLRLLHWDAYPMKSLPPGFYPGFLVELIMRDSKLEKLWEGIQPLKSLKKMDLSGSTCLKEIPDLSNATNLETLKLKCCTSLVTLPSFIRNLNKLKRLSMYYCKKLEALPTNINLESLSRLDLSECSQLKTFPEISQNIECLRLRNTAIEEVPSSFRLWSRLKALYMRGCKNLKTFPHVPDSVRILDLRKAGIEEVPPWIKILFRLEAFQMNDCKKLKGISSSISKLEHLTQLEFSGCTGVASFPAEIFQSFFSYLTLSGIHAKSLPVFLPEKASPFLRTLDLSYNDFESLPDCFRFLSQLDHLGLSCCRKLVLLPELSDSLRKLVADGCSSLERISGSFDNPKMIFRFTNCLKLNQEVQERIQQSVCRYALLPGREVPTCFTHRASGSFLTVQLAQSPASAFWKFQPCAVLSVEPMDNGFYWTWRDNIEIACHSRGKQSHPVFVHRWYERYCLPSFYENDVPSDHLIIFNPCSWSNKDDEPEAELSHNEILLEFNFTTPSYYEIRECGVQVLGPFVCNADESDTKSDGGYQTASSIPCSSSENEDE